MRVGGITLALSSMVCSIVVMAPAGATESGMIGVTTAATVISTGTPPNKNERILEVGTNMFANELVKTTDSGRAQLMFGDGSSLLVGPNSNVRLDKYVYNPDKKTGEIVLTATEGAFRYIGGYISKKTPVKFVTAAATIGIRGGINQFTVDPATGRVTTTHIFGIATTITVPGQNGQTTEFSRQDFQASILPGGQISYARMTAEQFNQINSMFERPPGVALAGLPAAGGVPGAPVNVPSVSNLVPLGLSGIESLGSALSIPQPIVIPAIRSFTPPPPPPPVIQTVPQIPQIPQIPSEGDFSAVRG